MGSPLTLQYLGQYHKMFDRPQEVPVPTWEALSWLLEDYGLSRSEDIPADPVCFRAAVFCNTLADWCGQWNVTIDVNQFSESHHEFLLLLKLQYRPTRWVRLVEAMAITHFIEGAHRCLIDEFPHTRAGPFEKFLRWQRLNAPERVELDDDLRRVIEKMEIRDNKIAATTTSQPQRPFHQPFWRQGC